MKSSGGTDEYRRERRRLGAVFRREAHLRGISFRDLAEAAQVHYNSVYRLLSGEDARLSSYQHLAQSLGLKLALLDLDEVLQAPQGFDVVCPACNQSNAVAAGDDSGWCVCACGERLRVLKVVSYTARLENKYERSKRESDD